MKVRVKLNKPDNVDDDVWAVNHQLVVESLHKFIDNIWPSNNIDVDVDISFTVKDVKYDLDKLYSLTKLGV